MTATPWPARRHLYALDMDLSVEPLKLITAGKYALGHSELTRQYPLVAVVLNTLDTARIGGPIHGISGFRKPTC